MVASAVLVSAGHVLQWNAEIVKRWSNEIQEAVQSKVGMVQVGSAWTSMSPKIASGSKLGAKCIFEPKTSAESEAAPELSRLFVDPAQFRNAASPTSQPFDA